MAVNTESVYNIVLTLLRKDQSGRAFSVDEFNRVIAMVNYEIFNDLLNLPDNKKRLHALKDFIERGYTVSLSSGVGNLPDDLVEILGKPYCIIGTSYVGVDLVGENEFTGVPLTVGLAPTPTRKIL